ncbi:nuclear transport factor 2 family protein [Aeromicrobium sp. 9AM]|uniref:nuclear transport factor 2 family protein n=1 Tax=Aeromicrobium sp. 9AM TaxID=2653126 RepID=UPI0012F34499|nr:nuclear transport factor 2 family protein [Aeromicrobium sp. 9AM]VXB62725.1 conserved hypothetical protein [Aeromicrobium sp. 9AM]
MDQERVTAAVERYVDAVVASDAEAVSAAFRADAWMWGYLGPDLVSAPISEFCQVVAETAEDDAWTADYSHTIEGIEVSGGVARATLKERGYRGGAFTNYFTLVRAAGEWSIASKTFYLDS